MLSTDKDTILFRIFVRNSRINCVDMKEDKTEVADGLFKVRTYGACLSEGIKLATRNGLVLMRHLWFSLLLLLLFASLLGMLLVPGFDAWRANRFFSEWPAWAVTGLFGVLCLLVLTLPGSLYVGHLAVLIRRYGKLGYLPALTSGLRWFDSEVLRSWRRTLPYIVAGVLIWALAGGIAFSLVGCGWLGGLLFVGLGLAFSIPYALTGLFLLLDEERGPSGLMLLRHRNPHWGAFTAVLLLGGALAVIPAGVACLPLGVAVTAEALAAEALRQGDVSDLPALFPLLQGVSACVSALLGALSFWLYFFPLSFFYGSVVQERREEVALKEEDKAEEE